MSFQLAPPAKTPLGRYRLLSPNAGIHVSPFCLGAMSIGTAWSGMMGTMDKESSFKLLDGFYEKGGNFIDTANNYQAETSEIVIGEWMKARNNRDQIVLATKYSLCYNAEDASVQQKVNYAGNSTKSMHISVGASLKKLQTDYIDILYVHFWDYATSVKEVMDSLHNLVQQGKVLYLGISDTPAWVVSQANQYARDFGKTPFVIYEGKWNILERDFERDIIPMARAHGMALAPWSVLAGGKLRSSKEENRRAETGEGGRTMLGTDWRKDESQTKMVEALEKVAAELGNDIDTTAVAIAYVMQKTPYVFPIIGGRKIEQLEANMQALTIQLTTDQIKFLESVQPFSVGFPHDFIGNDLDYGFWMRQAADYAPRPTALPVGHA